jgi:hypothetical protein
MSTNFKVFASYNILQSLCDFIHVLKFVIVSKCRKSPKLTNILIEAMFACFHTPSAALDDTEEKRQVMRMRPFMVF